MLTGECSNKECPFLHIDPESKIKDCPWYDRGFCKHGGSQSRTLCSSTLLLSTYIYTTYLSISLCLYSCLYIYIPELLPFFPSQVLTADTDTQEEWSVWTTLWASVQRENPVNSCSTLLFFMWSQYDRSYSALKIEHDQLNNFEKYSYHKNKNVITYSSIRVRFFFFLCSPRFELPMGASEQPPLPQQAQNQTKVRGYPHIYFCCVVIHWSVTNQLDGYYSLWGTGEASTSVCCCVPPTWCFVAEQCFLCLPAACAYHRPLVALSNPAYQLQSRPAAAEQHVHGWHSAK